MRDVDYWQHAVETKKFLKRDAPCFMTFYGQCSSQAINSHTISKSILKSIAEKGHIIMPRSKPHKVRGEGYVDFKKFGVGKASTFLGFCNKHDHELFKPIDSLLSEMSLEGATLYFLRSLFQEYQKKIDAYATYNSLLVLDSDYSQNSEHADNVKGLRLGAVMLRNQANEIVECVTNSQKNYFKFFAIEINSNLPFSYIGAYSHQLEEYELKSQFFPKHFRTMTYGLIPSKNGAHFFCIWHPEYSRYLTTFLDYFVHSKGNVIEFLFQYGLARTENFYMNPSWYDNLTNPERSNIVRYFQQTTSVYSIRSERIFPDLFASMDYRLKVNTNSTKVKLWARKNTISNF